MGLQALDRVLKDREALSKMSRGSIEKLAHLKIAADRLKRDGGIWAYNPLSHPSGPNDLYQVGFHKSTKKVRWAFGGNRSGKTEAAIAECVYWAIGEHPYRKVPVPNRGWIVSLDFNMSTLDAEKTFFRLLPRSQLLSFDKTRHIAYLRNGSEVSFKSCDQGKDKFQGTSLDWICFNEEPKYDVYEECLLRVIDRPNCCIWAAETPTAGMSWTYDQIYEMSSTDPDIDVFKFDIYWNEHIQREEIERLERVLDEDTKRMRLHGEFIQLAGRIFKRFDTTLHVIPPFVIPKDFNWSRFRGLDHGLNNPTACIWMACNREGECFIYDEYYENEKTIAENCFAIKQISGAENYMWSAIDGSTKTRKADDKFSYYDIYKNNGYIARPVWLTQDKVITAIDMINNLMAMNEKTQKPKFFIFDTCYNTIKEISRYRWKTFNKDDVNPTEKPADSMNHAITAIYFALLSGAKWCEPEWLMQEPVDERPWY